MNRFFLSVVSSISGSVLPDINLVFDGNSLVRGFNNSGQEQYFPNLVNDALSVNYNTTFNSFGVDSQKTADMIADATTQIYPLADPSKINILIAWEDANSIIQLDNGYDNTGTVSAAQNFADMETYFNGATGFQYKILITGYYPRKDITSGDYEIGSYKAILSSLSTQEDYFNLVLNADIWTVPWTHHIDLRNAPNIGGVAGQNENATYFNDYIHLQALGYEEISTMVINTINDILI